MTPEKYPSLERIYYECRLYGYDVYYDFAQYCFWRTVVRTNNQDWMRCLPAYFLNDKSD